MGTMNRKLRGFVIDEGTGVPLADVPLGVIAIGTGATHPDSSATVERTLGIFQSDHTGFFSIPLESSTRVESLAVYPLADPSHRIDVAPYLTVQEPTWAVPIPLSPKHHPGRHIGKAYPSIVLPDTFDWMLSPRSFATMEAAANRRRGLRGARHQPGRAPYLPFFSDCPRARRCTEGSKPGSQHPATMRRPTPTPAGDVLASGRRAPVRDDVGPDGACARRDRLQSRARAV
jgi:hypothetical protein